MTAHFERSKIIHLILNRKTDGMPEDAVYIGRGSKWGNPYKMRGRGGEERAIVIACYVLYLADSPGLLDSLHELKGRRLVCYCAPERCHGEILAYLANGVFDIEYLVKHARQYLEEKKVVDVDREEAAHSPAEEEIHG